MTALVADPMIGLRGGPGAGPPMNDQQSIRAAQQASSPPDGVGGGLSHLGGICHEDIRVPDKMVGLSKYLIEKLIQIKQ